MHFLKKILGLSVVTASSVFLSAALGLLGSDESTLDSSILGCPSIQKFYKVTPLLNVFIRLFLKINLEKVLWCSVRAGLRKTPQPLFIFASLV